MGRWLAMFLLTFSAQRSIRAFRSVLFQAEPEHRPDFNDPEIQAIINVEMISYTNLTLLLCRHVASKTTASYLFGLTSVLYARGLSRRGSMLLSNLGYVLPRSSFQVELKNRMQSHLAHIRYISNSLVLICFL